MSLQPIDYLWATDPPGSITVVNTGVPDGAVVTSDSVGSLEVILAESVSTPADAQTFDLAATSAETNSTPADTVTVIDLVNNTTDSATTPTGAHATAIIAGASTVAQTGAVNTGWSTPTNAQGIHDGATATINSASGLSPTNQQGTLTGTYTSVNGAGGLDSNTGNAVVTFYATLTVGLLATGSLKLDYSTDGGSNWTNVLNATATNAGPTFTATITAPASGFLANFRFRAIANVTGSATGASTATLDAVEVAFSTANNTSG